MQIVFLSVFTVLCSPFLWCLVLLRRQCASKHLLIIQRSKIGDLVCTTPLVRACAQAGYYVTVLTRSGSADVLKHNPHVYGILLDDDPQFVGMVGRLHLFWILFHSRYAISLSVVPGLLSSLCNVWTAAPVRIHTIGRSSGWLERVIERLQKCMTYARGTRTYDHYMQLAQCVGVSPVSYKHDMFLSEEEKRQAAAWLRDHDLEQRSYVVLSVTAGNVLKMWPLERFSELAEQILQQWNVVVVFSSANTEATACAVSLRQYSGSIVDGGGADLRLLAGIITRAAAFVSVDTGPLYIAHAFNVPVVDIVGPVHPDEQPPLSSERVALVLPPATIVPTSFVAETLRTELPEQKRALEETTVEMVYGAFAVMMRRVAPELEKTKRR
ncbi:hypothetical protein COU76_01985 [Candidatus Peregrinibacteria bacterium CG10_big_fil_rev_8_21_14_0_10_49_10]|nr:MAG: hypothetical protein COU76_01985 [Candidatus Peregrinibacteria bacterium CG10_big_fil_rev_8_21_14_0_10_49_10]